MPLFDRNKATSDLSAEIIDSANTAVEYLRRRKVAEIVLPETGTGLRVPNLVRCYLQSHIRRCLVFIEAALRSLMPTAPLRPISAPAQFMRTLLSSATLQTS
jgi:hypothetical protein